MRCIEIFLTLPAIHLMIKININMRCIEICFILLCVYNAILININMRCIEIVVTMSVVTAFND